MPKKYTATRIAPQHYEVRTPLGVYTIQQHNRGELWQITSPGNASPDDAAGSKADALEDINYWVNEELGQL